MSRSLLKQKHRVVVEIEFEDRITVKEAAIRVAQIVGCASSEYMEGVTACACKQWPLVFAAEFRKALRLKKRRAGIRVVPYYERGSRPAEK